MKIKSMLVVFRADASAEIGTGHIMRCLTLADELARQGHQCQFICREHDGCVDELVASRGYKIIILRVGGGAKLGTSGDENSAYADWLGVSWQQDADQSVEVLASIEADWLIVDHYALDARWERKVAKVVGRVMVIDDLADRHHECALLLDQNLGRSPSDYDGLVPEDCRRLIGPEYALLRPEFSELRGRCMKRRVEPTLKRILISLGGADRANVTGRVLDALATTALPPDIQLDIIMGAAASHLDEVRQQAARLPFQAMVSVNVSDMAQRMYMADLSIGAAGGTSWERCCLGLPAVLVVLADNQVAGAMALEEAGAAAVIGRAESVQVNLPILLQQLEELGAMRRMSDCAAAVTLGDGVSLVAQALVGMRNGRA